MIFDLLPGLGIVSAGALYLRGLVGARRVATWRVASLYAGLVVAVLAIYGPVGSASESLFSAHMVQHVLLMSVAAPLIVLGDAGRITRAGAPRPLVRAVASLPAGLRSSLRSPLVGAAAFIVALWAWHLPVLYELALRNPAVHAVEHISFFGTALLVWAAAFGRRRARPHVALLVVFVTSLAGAALGAIIVFAGSVLYRSHALAGARRGIDALVDQQLAGAIMWIPPGIVSLAVMVFLTIRIIGSEASAAPALGGGR